MKLLKTIFLILGLVISALFILYFSLGAKSYLEGSDLTVLDESIPSRYIFSFYDNRNVFIDDKFNQFVRSWGGSPENIKIENNIRIFEFNEPAILKTEEDSIEPHEEYVKIKGHMGIITEDTEFTVNSNGVISSNKWHGG
jgi:hypothetical protein